MAGREPLGDASFGFERNRDRLLPQPLTDRMVARFTGEAMTPEDVAAGGTVTSVQMHRNDVQFLTAYCRARRGGRVTEQDLAGLIGTPTNSRSAQAKALANKDQTFGFGAAMGQGSAEPEGKIEK